MKNFLGFIYLFLSGFLVFSLSIVSRYSDVFFIGMAFYVSIILLLLSGWYLCKMPLAIMILACSLFFAPALSFKSRDLWAARAKSGSYIRMDPRGNAIGVGMPCASCHGWFGDSFDRAIDAPIDPYKTTRQGKKK